MSESQQSQGASSQTDASSELASLAAAGERLKQLREAKGWSVEDVSSRLKVAPQKLAALEIGDISPMPGNAFALGVVRSYARILGVDPEPFAAVMRREHGHPAVDLSMPASAGAGLPRGKVSLSLGGSSHHRPWLWILLALLAIVVAAGIWLFSSGNLPNFTGHDKGLASEPEVASATLDASAVEAASAVEGASAVEPASAAEASVAAAVSAPAAVVASAPATASAAAPAKAAPAPAVAGTSDLAIGGASSASVTPAAGQSLISFTATQDSWFGVRDHDGKLAFQGLVHAGQSQQVAATPPLRVTVGNTLGVGALTIDGKPVDPAKYAHAQGNVAHLSLP